MIIKKRIVDSLKWCIGKLQPQEELSEANIQYSSFVVEKAYDELNKTADRSIERLATLERNMTTGKFKIEGAPVAEELEKLIRGSHSEFPASDLTSYINISKSLASNIKSLTSNMRSSSYFEVRKQKAIRAAERRDMWSLWVQKYIRWAIGIFAAVMLYSCLAWFSDNYSFIKIPVRDLLYQPS